MLVLINKLTFKLMANFNRRNLKKKDKTTPKKEVLQQNNLATCETDPKERELDASFIGLFQVFFFVIPKRVIGSL